MSHFPKKTIPQRRSLTEAFQTDNDRQQWLQIISAILERISIPPEELEDAIGTYHRLGDSVGKLLEVERTELDIHGQGSVVQKTVMRSHGNSHFDVDAVCVRVSSVKMSAKDWFEKVGGALSKLTWVSRIEKKNRCWRVFFNDKRYYIDFTPALPDDIRQNTFVEVFSSEEDYPTSDNPSPSDPRGYTRWFEKIADEAPLLEGVSRSAVLAKAEPIDTSPVHEMDVLRRAIQLMKFHRDNYYRSNSSLDARYKPISVIMTTLATESFARRRNSGLPPLDLLLHIVDDMWDVPKIDDVYWVRNPAHPLENFADKWPKDDDARETHYFRWLDRFGADLTLLKDAGAKEPQIMAAFGAVGVEGWKAGNAVGATVLKRLADKVPAYPTPAPKQNSTLA